VPCTLERKESVKIGEGRKLQRDTKKRKKHYLQTGCSFRDQKTVQSKAQSDSYGREIWGAVARERTSAASFGHGKSFTANGLGNLSESEGERCVPGLSAGGTTKEQIGLFLRSQGEDD